MHDMTTHHFTGAGSSWATRVDDMHSMFDHAGRIITMLAQHAVTVDPGLVLRVSAFTDTRTIKGGVRVETNNPALLATLSLGWQWWPAGAHEADPTTLWGPHLYRAPLSKRDTDDALRFWHRERLGKLPKPRVLDVQHELANHASWHRFDDIAARSAR